MESDRPQHSTTHLSRDLVYKLVFVFSLSPPVNGGPSCCCHPIALSSTVFFWVPRTHCAAGCYSRSSRFTPVLSEGPCAHIHRSNVYLLTSRFVPVQEKSYASLELELDAQLSGFFHSFLFLLLGESQNRFHDVPLTWRREVSAEATTSQETATPSR